MNAGYLLCNRYCIQKILAAGWFCTTYLAIDREYSHQKYVIIKQLKPQNRNPALFQVASRLFEMEAVVLKSLGAVTDRIPTLYAYFEERSEFYLVQEFIEGHTLAQELANGKLSTIATIKVLREILTILKFVHAENTIHRDLKPDNIIRRMSDQALVLIDFGSVKEVRSPAITVSQEYRLASIGFGTEGYMPSEQAMGYPKLASDIYAVGAIGLECLTGREPHELFDDQLMEFKWRYLYRISNPKIDPLITPLVMVLNKMLQQRYLDRYANAAEALAAIEHIEQRYSYPAALVKSIDRKSAYSIKPPAVMQKVALPSIDRLAVAKLIGLGALIASSSTFIAHFSHNLAAQLNTISLEYIHWWPKSDRK
jgi:serine/threonine protein kinase